MTVFLVGAGPGDPALITMRGAELLSRAEVVVFDRLASPQLLELAPAGAERVNVGNPLLVCEWSLVSALAAASSVEDEDAEQV